MKKVALIEDEKDLAEIYSLKLSMEGIEPIIINDPSQAIEILKNNLPDLILLDIMMPEIDGFGLFEKIKAEDLLKNVKVFIWSNLTQKKDKERAEKLKINGYLVKSDYTPTSLATKLKNFLN